jgi:type II secretion system protein G
MTVVRRTRKGGFTLVEILIVVIILGILAAIVIPQFTSASQDARKNSLTSQLQTLRSQIELYKLQHLDNLPSELIKATGANWSQFTVKTNDQGTTGTGTAYPFGPYLQADPKNPLNGGSLVGVVGADVAPGSAYTGAHGFVINSVNGKIWGTSAKTVSVGSGFIYDEATPSASTNDN